LFRGVDDGMMRGGHLKFNPQQAWLILVTGEAQAAIEKTGRQRFRCSVSLFIRFSNAG
jgi:hypothetical protein